MDFVPLLNMLSTSIALGSLSYGDEICKFKATKPNNIHWIDCGQVSGGSTNRGLWVGVFWWLNTDPFVYVSLISIDDITKTSVGYFKIWLYFNGVSYSSYSVPQCAIQKLTPALSVLTQTYCRSDKLIFSWPNFGKQSSCQWFGTIWHPRALIVMHIFI